mmetsp:Transcript_12194/g.14728  ORF Transcript_12194/g.14728 Transcript_12194/m.14728 type:complete len:145 (-) Transcript_12194:1205-1639(-)
MGCEGSHITLSKIVNDKIYPDESGKDDEARPMIHDPLRIEIPINQNLRKVHAYDGVYSSTRAEQLSVPTSDRNEAQYSCNHSHFIEHEEFGLTMHHIERKSEHKLENDVVYDAYIAVEYELMRYNTIDFTPNVVTGRIRSNDFE